MKTVKKGGCVSMFQGEGGGELAHFYMLRLEDGCLDCLNGFEFTHALLTE
jgi:hypothetical protein